MEKLKRLFCYCGVSKEEYNSVKKDAYVSNFVVWKYLHIFISVAYALYFLSDLVYDGASVGAFLKLGVALYSLVITGLFFSGRVKDDSLIGQLIIYLTMIILLISTFVAAMDQSGMMAVSFVVMLVLLPMFMIDKPYFMALVIFLASVVFIGHAEVFESEELFVRDSFNVVTFGLLGIIINTFYNSIRVKEFLLNRDIQRNVEEQEKSIEETNKLNETLEKMSESLVDVLGDVVESRDSESGQHIQRVRGYTNILANQVREDLPEYMLNSYKVNLMTFASSLHDVGKISIPDSILFKPGRLTDEEFDIMKTHCAKGCQILMKMAGSWSKEYLDMGLDICMYHHEKWDGKGYPQGLKGDEIPISAQIVSIADVYDALTSERPYKEAYSNDVAFAMIINGECGAYSGKLLNCFVKCKDKFDELTKNPDMFEMPDHSFEVVSKGKGTGFVIGFHDQDKTLQDNLKLSEELSVVSSLSERFCYICYVNMSTNTLVRFKANRKFSKIIDSLPDDLPNNKKFDLMLNTIIVSEDYDAFKKATHREEAVAEIQKNGHMNVDFRARLEDGVHHCRMKLTQDPNDSDAVIIGIMYWDEEFAREEKALALQRELDETRKEMENRENLEDQLAVINCVSSDYDYVCTLNRDNFAVKVYRAEPWIRDMFKNLDDIVSSPDARNRTLKGIIHPEDFDNFVEASKHENVMKGLMEGNGSYAVNYRAYKYGNLINYQTRYALDRDNPKRIIIGLHSTDV